MLKVAKVGMDPRQQMYYDNSVALGADDYYAGKGEAPGSWIATSLGAEIGVDGTITREQLQWLMDGRHPVTGEILQDRSKVSMEVAAYDLMFTLPKSLSVLYAMGDAQLKTDIRQVLDESVGQGLTYIEREGARVRRGKNGEEVYQSRLLAAGYFHRTSRFQDPQLHTHVIVPNMAPGPDGRWTALHGKMLYEHMKAAGAVQEAYVRQRWIELHPEMKWGKVVGGLAEILDVPREVIVEFSTRRRQILERQMELELEGIRVGARGRQRIALDTREQKLPVNWPELETMIRERAAEHGFSVDDLDQLLALEVPARRLTPESIEVLEQRLIVEGGLTYEANTFSRAKIQFEVASAFPSGATLEQIDEVVDQMLAHKEIVQIPTRDGMRYTTADLLRAERNIQELVEKGAGKEFGVLGGDVADRVLAARARGGAAANVDQAAVVRAVLTNGNQMDVIEALAGTGKTWTAGVIREAYEDAGWRVIGAAPSGRAARELKDEAAIEESHTIHYWLERFDNDRQEAIKALTTDRKTHKKMNTILILDEGGMAPSRRASEFLTEADAAGVKIAAFGDSGQLHGVEASGWFGRVARAERIRKALGQKTVAITSHSLTEPLRQVLPDGKLDKKEIAALRALHDGRPKEWIEHKRSRNEIEVFAGARPAIDAHERAVELYLENRDRLTTKFHLRLSEKFGVEHADRFARTIATQQAAIVANDNMRRAEVNAKIRAALKERGELQDAVTVAGQEFAVGDRVIARINEHKGVDVDNGTRGTIVEIRPHVGITIMLDGAEKTGTPEYRRLPIEYLAKTREDGGQALEHAYVLTTEGTQGATIEWGIGLAQVHEMTRNRSYTAASRWRESWRLLLIDQPSNSELEVEALSPGLGSEPDRDIFKDLEDRMKVRNDELTATEQLAYSEPAPAIKPIEPVKVDEGRNYDVDNSQYATRGMLDTHQPAPSTPLFAAALARYTELQTDLKDINKELANPAFAAANDVWKLDARRREHIKQIEAMNGKRPAFGQARREHDTKRRLHEQEATRLAEQIHELTPTLGGDSVQGLRATEDQLKAERRTVFAESQKAHADAVVEELATNPPWVQRVLGRKPDDRGLGQDWERTARYVAGDRIRHGIIDPIDDGLNIVDAETRRHAIRYRGRVGLTNPVPALDAQHAIDVGPGKSVDQGV